MRDENGAPRRFLDLYPEELDRFWKLLWAAVPSYAAFGLWWRGAGEPADPPAAWMHAVAWGGAALCSFAFLAVPPLLTGHVRYAHRCLLRWGLAECIALAGCILYLCGGSPRIFFVFLAWSLSLHATSPPRADAG